MPKQPVQLSGRCRRKRDWSRPTLAERQRHGEESRNGGVGKKKKTYCFNPLDLVNLLLSDTKEA
jgi:hypothetical protein